MYTPYDFNQSIAHRAEYVEERLKGGSPVVGVSYDRGALFFAVRRTQRKVFEVYDQLMYSALGNQADVEAVRLAAIDFAHQEGFQRSPDDVSIQRLVGFAISPPLKRIFGDPMSTPHVLRAIFAEVGRRPEQDVFFILNYDGEFSSHHRFAAVAGTAAAEDAIREQMDAYTDTPDLATALRRAADAWRLGSRIRPLVDDDDDEDEARRASTGSAPGGGGSSRGSSRASASSAADDDEGDPLQKALEDGHLEAAVLERDTPRESKFRMLRDDELGGVGNHE